MNITDPKEWPDTLYSAIYHHTASQPNEILIPESYVERCSDTQNRLAYPNQFWEAFSRRLIELTKAEAIEDGGYYVMVGYELPIDRIVAQGLDAGLIIFETELRWMPAEEARARRDRLSTYGVAPYRVDTEYGVEVLDPRLKWIPASKPPTLHSDGFALVSRPVIAYLRSGRQDVVTYQHLDPEDPDCTPKWLTQDSEAWDVTDEVIAWGPLNEAPAFL